MHLAKSKRIVWIGKQMKMKRNIHTRTRKRVRENRKEENKNIKRFSEWEKEKAIAWMDWATANNVNNFISSLFLSPSLMPKKVERVSHLFMLLLCDLLVYFFRLSPFFSLFHFYSLLLFCLFGVVIFIFLLLSWCAFPLVILIFAVSIAIFCWDLCRDFIENLSLPHFHTFNIEWMRERKCCSINVHEHNCLLSTGNVLVPR